MAWLDNRTTSGSLAGRHATSRTCRPGSSRRSAARRRTGRARRRASSDYEFKARTYYGGVDGANLLDWPITLADLAPYYDKAEIAMGSTHRHGRPPLPANNNYKVFANGAEKVGYKLLRDRPLRHQRRAVRRPPGVASRTASTSRATSTAKWCTAVREIPRALATGKCDLRAESQAVQITHDAQGRANAVLYLDATATCTARRPRSSASPATRSSRRGCC